MVSIQFLTSHLFPVSLGRFRLKEKATNHFHIGQSSLRLRARQTGWRCHLQGSEWCAELGQK